MRAPVSWLRELADVPADATGAEIAASLVKVGLEEEALHGGDITGPLVVGRVLEARRSRRTARPSTGARWTSARTARCSPRARPRGPCARTTCQLDHVVCVLRVGVRRRSRLTAQDLRPRLERHDLLGDGARAR